MNELLGWYGYDKFSQKEAQVCDLEKNSCLKMCSCIDSLKGLNFIATSPSISSGESASTSPIPEHHLRDNSSPPENTGKSDDDEGVPFRRSPSTVELSGGAGGDCRSPSLSLSDTNKDRERQKESSEGEDLKFATWLVLL